MSFFYTLNLMNPSKEHSSEGELEIYVKIEDGM